MIIFFHIRTVACDGITAFHSRYFLFCFFNSPVYNGFGCRCICWRHQTHINPYFRAVRHYIRAVAAGDLSESDCRDPQIMMGRACLDLFSDAADGFCHSCNGIGSFPWITCMGGNSCYGQFKPGPSLVSHLDLAVCRFCIQDPVIFCDPAGLDSSFYTTHKVLFIYRTDHSKWLFRQFSCFSYLFYHVFKSS